jgi:hypothetical protein
MSYKQKQQRKYSEVDEESILLRSVVVVLLLTQHLQSVIGM